MLNVGKVFQDWEIVEIIHSGSETKVYLSKKRTDPNEFRVLKEYDIQTMASRIRNRSRDADALINLEDTIKESIIKKQI